MDEKTHHINFSKIPPEFYSDLTGKPFENCINCGKFLLDYGTIYMIEKAIIQTQPHQTKNTVFEYAMCYDCWLKTKEKLSKESLQRIKSYFEERVNLQKRFEEKRNETRLDHWIGNCMITGKSKDELSEYQIACQCDGPEMAHFQMPYLISGEVTDEIMQLLSEQTLGEMDNFKDKLMTPSPDLQELFTRKKILLV